MEFQELRKSLHWNKKKTWITVLCVCLLGAGSFYFTRRGTTRRNNTQASFVRTTVLKKTTLNNSISLTGTVESAAVSNVTTNQSLSVKSIPVQVGDWVKAGDIICVLDTEEIDKNIEKTLESLQESADQAKESLASAEENLTWAQSDADSAWNTMAEKETAMNSAKTAYESARSSVDAFQANVDQAQAAYQSLMEAENEALSQLNAAISTGECSGLEDTACTAGTNYQNAKQASKDAKAKAESAQQDLKTAQSAMNYDALAAAYTSAQTAYNSAVNAWNTARNQRDNWETKVTEAKEALEKASASDALDDLYEKRENCTLRAETAGKVTAINVTVGSMAGNNTTIATIQDTEALKISVTIPEYEIQNVELGMSAKITTDATEGEIEGTLTQISPVASSQNSTGFSAEVTVTTPNSGLYVGINATVEIIQSTVDNVFVVPIDAVGTNDQGEAVVFVKESGSGAEAVFKEVSVTTGEENDYYIEISSSQLSEGMEVRSSADPEQAQVNMTEGNAQDLSNNAGVQFDMGGAMPSGEMPSGGGPGGNGGAPGGRGGNG
ncbi:efflux RND transporter periplasmic adaptor subunit [Holdemania massiliensis]|uniref:efflux RND transporter periplasmic adaptor subunit n=1 Tax=Holdemania massiliensis TaxID=1468449 RepID=UPI00058FD027|nr:efflux RND transporter periplasmic adaptor subunit [Holdemania massiliensis]